MATLEANERGIIDLSDRVERWGAENLVATFPAYVPYNRNRSLPDDSIEGPPMETSVGLDDGGSPVEGRASSPESFAEIVEAFERLVGEGLVIQRPEPLGLATLTYLVGFASFEVHLTGFDQLVDLMTAAVHAFPFIPRSILFVPCAPPDPTVGYPVPPNREFRWKSR
jgi:hypothetical protein